MSRLGRLWSKIEGGNRAKRDSSNQQLVESATVADGSFGLPPASPWYSSRSPAAFERAVGFLVKTA